MKRLLNVIILALLSAPAYAINWGNLMYFHQGVASKPFAVTIADDGAGTAAASTLTSPVFATYRYTCSDTDGCGLTIGETNVVDGQYLTLYNVSANAITLTASAGVLQLSTATFAMAQYQQIHLQYQSDRWVEISRGGTSIGSASVDTTANYTWTGAHVFNGTVSGSPTYAGTGSYFAATPTSTNAVADEMKIFRMVPIIAPSAHMTDEKRVGVEFGIEDSGSNNIYDLYASAIYLGHTATGTARNMVAQDLFAYISTTGAMNAFWGYNSYAYLDGTGDIATSAIMYNSVIENDNAGSAITNPIGVQVQFKNNSGTMTSPKGISVLAPTNGGTMTDNIGLNIADQSVGTGTPKSIYVAGTAKIEFDPPLQADGGITLSPSYTTATNCSDSAGDAACGAAPAGSVVVDATDTTTVVSTTAVTANSQIFLQVDSSLGTRLSVTCNTQDPGTFDARVTARTAATSFTITLDAGPTTNPLCLSYFIVN